MKMSGEGRYIYCIVKSQQERNFGRLGVGQGTEDVSTIGYEDLSAVVSNHPVAKVVANSQNLLAHQRVIETVMKEFDSVLPVRFGTVATSGYEIRNLLDRRYGEFKRALRDFEYMLELGVKAVWRDMAPIFWEIAAQNTRLRRRTQRLRIRSCEKTREAKAAVGMEVFRALQEKKLKEATAIVDSLRRTSVAHKLNENIGDEMFLNSAFLVDAGREKEFDNIMDDLCEEHGDRVKFMYAGPLPIFNFVNIVIHRAEWER